MQTSAHSVKTFAHFSICSHVPPQHPSSPSPLVPEVILCTRPCCLVTLSLDCEPHRGQTLSALSTGVSSVQQRPTELTSEVTWTLVGLWSTSLFFATWISSWEKWDGGSNGNTRSGRLRAKEKCVLCRGGWSFQSEHTCVKRLGRHISLCEGSRRMLFGHSESSEFSSESWQKWQGLGMWAEPQTGMKESH